MAVNGKSYSYENIQVVMAGKVGAEITEANYKETPEYEKQYVLGLRGPKKINEKNTTYEGSIGMTYNEYVALQRSIEPGKSITQIAAFDILVTVQLDDGTIMTDRLKECRIAEVDKSFKAEETYANIVFPLEIGRIDYNI